MTMKTLCAVLLISILILPYTHGQTLNAENVLEKYAEAIGGTKKIKKIKSFSLKGKTRINGLDGDIQIMGIYPQKLRRELTVKGQTIIQGSNGKTGWIKSFVKGEHKAEKVPVGDVLEKDYLLIVPGLKLFTHSKIKGDSTLTLEGIHKFEGKDAYKIGFKIPGEEPEYYYFDKNSFYLLGREVKTTKVEKELMLDYQAVNGIQIPFSIKNLAHNREIHFDEISLNTKLDNSIFEIPLHKK